MAEATEVVALESGYYGLKGESIRVIAGERFAKDDPLVKKYPTKFGPVSAIRARSGEPVIEQATAAPGEKRG